MKLIQREPVPGSDPVIYIGHRTYRSPAGKEAVAGTWSAEYRHQGQAHYESLGTHNKQAAIRSAHRILERLERGEIKRVIRRLAWPEFNELYLDHVTVRGRGPKTLVKYRQILATLVDFAEARGITTPSRFTAEHFWAFSKHLRDGGNEEKTVFLKLMFLKQLFKWASGTKKLWPTNPLLGEHVEVPPATEQPCFTEPQVAKILAQANAMDRPVFTLMAYTGMRFGEVRDLRWTDLHLDRGRYGQIFVQRGGSLKTTKGKANRVIPIHPELRVVLDALPRLGELVFYEPAETLRDPAQRVPLRERKLLARLKRTCKQCGLERPLRYKLHTFRHSFASMCARENVSYKYALEWLGHKSSEILDLYYTMFDAVADAAMAHIKYAAAEAEARSA